LKTGIHSSEDGNRYVHRSPGLFQVCMQIRVDFTPVFFSAVGVLQEGDAMHADTLTSCIEREQTQARRLIYCISPQDLFHNLFRFLNKIYSCRLSYQ
jgi:hypothetical protein